MRPFTPKTLPLLALLFASPGWALPTPLVRPLGRPDALVDLRTDDGARAVSATWRYHDVDLVEVDGKAPGPDLKPSGAAVRTHDYAPKAGARGLRRHRLGSAGADGTRRAPRQRQALVRVVSPAVHGAAKDRRLRSDGRDGRIRDRDRRLRRGVGRREARARARTGGRRRRRRIQRAESRGRGAERQARPADPARRLRNERADLGEPEQLHLDQVGDARFLQAAAGRERRRDRATRSGGRRDRAADRRGSRSSRPDSSSPKDRSGSATAATCSSATRTTTASIAGRPTASSPSTARRAATRGRTSPSTASRARTA